MNRSLLCNFRPHADRFGMKREDGGPLEWKASHVPLELKADVDANDPEGTLEGYGSKFGIADSYNESVRKGAFRSSLAEWRKRKDPIPMLWQHMGNEPIGAWTDFKEDDVGLRLKGELIMEIPQAKVALASIRARVVKGLSIGYFEIDADPFWDPEREGPRELRKLDLREVSVVTFPALREANLDALKARVLRGEVPTVRDHEALIQREMGISRNDARFITEHGYKAWVAKKRGSEGHDDDADTACDQAISSTIAQLSKPLFA